MEHNFYFTWMNVAYRRGVLNEETEKSYLNMVKGFIGAEEYSDWVS